MQMLEHPQLQPPLPTGWIRLPRFGEKCPYTGLSRTALDHLIRPQPWNKRKPPVESRILQIDSGPESGHRAGIVLVNYASLMTYIDGLPKTRPMKQKASAARAQKATTPRRRRRKEPA
jgi:hypothetical protein